MQSHGPALPSITGFVRSVSPLISVFGIAAVRISELSYGKHLGADLQPQELVLVRERLITVSIRDD